MKHFQSPQDSSWSVGAQKKLSFANLLAVSHFCPDPTSLLRSWWIPPLAVSRVHWNVPFFLKDRNKEEIPPPLVWDRCG